MIDNFFAHLFKTGHYPLGRLLYNTVVVLVAIKFCHIQYWWQRQQTTTTMTLTTKTKMTTTKTTKTTREDNQAFHQLSKQVDCQFGNSSKFITKNKREATIVFFVFLLVEVMVKWWQWNRLVGIICHCSKMQHATRYVILAACPKKNLFIMPFKMPFKMPKWLFEMPYLPSLCIKYKYTYMRKIYIWSRSFALGAMRRFTVCLLAQFFTALRCNTLLGKFFLLPAQIFFTHIAIFGYLYC